MNLFETLSKISKEEELVLSGQEIRRPDYFSGNANVIDSGRILAGGRPMDIRVHTRFADFPEHSHNYIEIIYMFCGCTTHIVNGGKELKLNEGEFLLLNQHATHRILKAEKGDIAVNIIILPQFFDSALELIGRDNILAPFLINGLKTKNEGLSYLHFKTEREGAACKNADALILNFLEGGLDYKLHRLSLGLLLLQLMGNTGAMEIKEEGGAMKLITAKALSLIERNPAGASLEELALQNNVSSAYISKAVKKITGKTFKEILIEKRLSKAASLLSKTNLSVQDICFAVGYDNTSHFYRLFTKYYNLSPANYRRLNKDA